jgi:UDP-N-acetyl-D-galactosamine dehydrogenase
LRNTRVVDIVAELQDYNCKVDVYDPWVTVAEADHEYGIKLLTLPEPGAYDGIVLAVAHHQFKTMGVEAIRTLGKQNHVLYDLKYLFPADATDMRL